MFFSLSLSLSPRFHPLCVCLSSAIKLYTYLPYVFLFYFLSLSLSAVVDFGLWQCERKKEIDRRKKKKKKERKKERKGKRKGRKEGRKPDAGLGRCCSSSVQQRCTFVFAPHIIYWCVCVGGKGGDPLSTLVVVLSYTHLRYLSAGAAGRDPIGGLFLPGAEHGHYLSIWLYTLYAVHPAPPPPQPPRRACVALRAAVVAAAVSSQRATAPTPCPTLRRTWLLRRLARAEATSARVLYLLYSTYLCTALYCHSARPSVHVPLPPPSPPRRGGAPWIPWQSDHCFFCFSFFFFFFGGGLTLAIRPFAD